MKVFVVYDKEDGGCSECSYYSSVIIRGVFHTESAAKAKFRLDEYYDIVETELE